MKRQTSNQRGIQLCRISSVKHCMTLMQKNLEKYKRNNNDVMLRDVLFHLRHVAKGIATLRNPKRVNG